MRKVLLLNVLLSLLAGGLWAQDTATADEIIQRYMEQTGIADMANLWEPYTTLSTKTTVMASGKEMVVQQIYRSCDAKAKKLFVKVDSGDKKQRMALACNGEEGWYRIGVSMTLKYKQKEFDQLWQHNQGLLQVPYELSNPFFFRRELKEEQIIDGKVCSVVLITSLQNEEVYSTWYFDKETGLLRRIESSQGTVSDYLAYRTFGKFCICSKHFITYSEELSKKTKIREETSEIQDIWLGKVDESLFNKDAVKKAFDK